MFIISDIDEGIEVLNKLDPEEVKLFFVDDSMANKAGADSVSLGSVGVHHQNLILIYNVQNIFVVNARTIRENSSYIFIWPNYTQNLLEQFLRQYPQEAKSRIYHILSPEGQKEADGMDREFLTLSKLPSVRTPVIIDKSTNSGEASMKIYAGLFDNNPLVVPFVSERGAAGGFKSYEDKRDELFHEKFDNAVRLNDG